MVYIIGETKAEATGGGINDVGSVPLLDTNLDDGSWEEDPEISDEFEPCLWVVMQQNDITMDPTMSAEDSLRGSNIGILSASFGKWTIFVNWQLKWSQVIPPHHVGVEYDGELKGVISPYLTMRTCWHCRRGNPLNSDGVYNDAGYWVYPPKGFLAKYPFMPNKWPAVYPANPCPDCGEYDWFAATIEREALQRDAAEETARLTEIDKLAMDMRIKHDPMGNEGMSVAKTNV